MVKDRAQGAEQEIAEMAVEPDHPGESLSAEMRLAAQWMGARQRQISTNLDNLKGEYYASRR